MNLWTLVILLALAGLALLSWSLRALDAWGAIAAFVLGLTVALAADLKWLALMTLFTVLGVLATAAGMKRKKVKRVAEARGGERGWRNVVANGTAAALAALALAYVDPVAAALAFASAIAAVTADTMASEIGALSPNARCIVPPFETRTPGENGGVSWRGQVAAFAGASAIGLAAIPLLGIEAKLAWIPIVAGFAGCQLDSVLGATLEKDATHDRPLSKNHVNFIASVVPAAVVLLVAGL